MNVSSMMSAPAKQMHQTLNSSLLQSALSTQAATSIKMLDKMNETTENVVSPHPTLGKNIDLNL